MQRSHVQIIFILFATAFLAACNSPYTSRKAGYFKIEFPEHSYRQFDSAGFPYTFEYPVYGQIMRDSTYFDNNATDKYWVNIDIPRYNAKLFLSYKDVGGMSMYKSKQADGSYKDSLGRNSFEKLVNDAYNLTSKNEIVATSINDSVFVTPIGVSGIFFRVGGNAATARQFFVTDSARYFLRGALYFDATPNADSLRPVNEFLQHDLQHLINTLRWK